MTKEVFEFDNYTKEKENLVAVLEEIQGKVGYISREAMEKVADFFSVSSSDVYSLVTFYKKFRRKPPGLYPITICMGTACYLMGAELVLSAIERELEIKLGETTPDGLFSIDTAACFGCCNFAPVIKIKDKIIPGVTCSKVEEIIVNLRVI
jgi:NADH:ubiquinone oxidoreductase subunit E